MHEHAQLIHVHVHYISTHMYIYTYIYIVDCQSCPVAHIPLVSVFCGLGVVGSIQGEQNDAIFFE